MTIKLQYNASPKNKINKNVTDVLSLNGYLKDDCDIKNPVIQIEAASLPAANYLYISDFNRHYFITDVTNNTKNLWTIKAVVDVLYSFKDAILSNTVILDNSETTEANDYISDPAWLTTVKTKTDVVNFPSGLSANGSFILITAGGVPTL